MKVLVWHRVKIRIRKFPFLVKIFPLVIIRSNLKYFQYLNHLSHIIMVKEYREKD